MILFVREGIVVRLQRRVWFSLGLFDTVLAVQILGGIGTQLLSQVAVAMLVTIMPLLLPNWLYQKLFGWIRVPPLAKLKLPARAHSDER
jgi:hypothetical protein